MVQAYENFSKEEQLDLLLHGISYAMYEANKDKENYVKFINGDIAEFNEKILRDMNILEILRKLGYSDDELGTYLYKDVIAEVYTSMKDFSSRNDIGKLGELMSNLNNAYSSFYHRIAREWKEMGVNAFHLYIQKAIDKIEDNSIDIELSKKIFGDNPVEQNYGLQAFQIAAYFAKKYSYEDVDTYTKPVVRKLSNMPNDLKSKDNF